MEPQEQTFREIDAPHREDYTVQLSAKIRDQAARLRMLEEKKQQWTKFKETVCGGIYAYTQSDSEFFENLNSKFSEQEKECEELRQLVKAEVLTSEQQRAYIEVLKQGMSINLEEIGIFNGDADLLTNYNNLYQSYESLQRENAQMRAAIGDLEFQVSRQTNKVSDAAAINLDLENERNQFKLEAEEASEQLRVLSGHVQTLETQNEELRAQQVTYDRVMAERESLDAALTKVTEECEDNAAQLAEKTAFLDKITASLNVTEQQLRDVTEKYDAVMQDLNEVQASYQEEVNKTDRLTTENRENAAQIERLMAQSSSTAAKVERSQAKLDTVGGRCNALEEENSGLHARTNKLQAKLEKSQSKFAALKTKYRTIKESVSNTQRDLENTRNSFASKELEVEDLQTRVKELMEYRTRTESLEQVAKKSKQKYKGVRAEAGELHTTLEYQRNKAAGLEDKLRQERVQKELIQMELDTAKREATDLKESNSVLRSRNDDLATSLGQLQPIYEAQITQLSETERQLEDQQAAAVSYQDQIRELAYYQKLKEQTIDTLQDQVTNLKFKNDTLSTDLAQVRDSMVQIQSSYDQMSGVMASRKDLLPPWAAEVLAAITKVLTSFGQNMQVMMASSQRYSSILSSQMKMFCDKTAVLGANAPGDMSLCHEWVMVSIAEIEALVNRMKGTDYLLASPAYSIGKRSMAQLSPYSKPPLAASNRQSYDGRISPDVKFYE